jgi:hypothetical protein
MDVITNANANKPPRKYVFRYKLSDDTMTLIADFSKLHKYDDRHAYKDAWALWLTENRDFIAREESRLKEIGFHGDVIDKMFKAGRYYFREKREDKSKKNGKNGDSGGKVKVREEEEEGKVNKKITRAYISMNPEFIEAINVHLTKSMKENDFKPQTSFIQFVEENKDILQVEVRRLYEIINYNTLNDETLIHDVNDSDRKKTIHKEIMTKLKKTFKNRYFALSAK